MTIGTGIAIAGVWLLPCAALIAKRVESQGVWLAVIIASIVTYCLA